jgi:hypothetical protein
MGVPPKLATAQPGRVLPHTRAGAAHMGWRVAWAKHAASRVPAA